MPNNVHKSAAVPFVNQKGERSMKRVKVERYVAGKKPAYAKDEDDDEYYTTDEEEETQFSDQEPEDEESLKGEDDEEEEDDDDKQGQSCNLAAAHPGYQQQIELDEEEEEEDDPRFRKLKQLDSKSTTSLIGAQTTSRQAKIEDRIIIDDDEEEEDIRERHALARARTLEKPIGVQVELHSSDLADQSKEAQHHSQAHKSRQEQTDDILKDLKLTGIKPKLNKAKEDAETEQKLKDMLEQAKQESIFQAQIHKKIDEDVQKELEREALAKGGVGTNDIEAIKTDDEDEELAYEEWKLREIRRVLRDRSERALEAQAR